MGIWTSVNDGTPQCAVFDTGSDQLNMQINTRGSGVKNGWWSRDNYIYLYGDSTYGYLIQKVTIEYIKCYTPQDIDGVGQRKKTRNPVTSQQ